MSARRGLVLLALACGCATLRPTAPVRELPRVFCGRFQWTKEHCGAAVRLTIATLTQSGRRVVYTGSHLYDGLAGRYVMQVRGEIDTRSRRVVIHESEPAPRETAVVDGAFDGRITADLGAIAAIWTTRTTGELGVLTLHAEGTPGPECPEPTP